MRWRQINRLAVFALLPVLVAACAGGSVPGGEDAASAPPPPRVDSNSASQDEGPCRLDDVQSAVGSPLSDTSSESLARQSGAEQTRVLRPGEAATLDHRPERLNIHLNDEGVIAELSCG